MSSIDNESTTMSSIDNQSIDELSIDELSMDQLSIDELSMSSEFHLEVSMDSDDNSIIDKDALLRNTMRYCNDNDLNMKVDHSLDWVKIEWSVNLDELAPCNTYKCWGFEIGSPLCMVIESSVSNFLSDIQISSIYQVVDVEYRFELETESMAGPSMKKAKKFIKNMSISDLIDTFKVEPEVADSMSTGSINVFINSEDREHTQTETIINGLMQMLKSSVISTSDQILIKKESTVYMMDGIVIPIEFIDRYEGNMDLAIESWLNFTIDGLISIIKSYLSFRLRNYNEYCMLCDTRTDDSYQKNMRRPFVCNEPLCTFRHQLLDLNVQSLNDSNMSHLLILMAKAAAHSSRHEWVFDPFPSIVDRNDQSISVLSSNDRDIKRAREMIDIIPDQLEFYKSYSNYEQQLYFNKKYDNGITSYDLMNWIIESNRATIGTIPREHHLSVMGSTNQYILLLDAPEKESVFQSLKAKHGTTFGFHGSVHSNWHSILRNGLKNASGSKFQLNGAAHGSGVYLHRNSSYSYGYSLNYRSKKGEKEINAQFICLAICEAINEGINHHGKIMVVPDESKVCTRFLMVYYRDKDTYKFPTTPYASCDDLEFETQLRTLMEVLSL